MVETVNACKNFCVEARGKCSRVRAGKCEDDIKVDLMDVGHVDGRWMELVQDCV